MKKAYFEALNLRMDLKENQRYYDLGFVDDRNETHKKIEEILGFHIKRDYFTEEEEGFCLTFRWADGFQRTFVGVSDRYRQPWVIRGHEETHALVHFNKLDLLVEKIEKEIGAKIQLPELKGVRTKFQEEIIASLGGLYAMMIRGIYIDTSFPHIVANEKFCVSEADRVLQKAIALKLGIPFNKRILI
jgi:hypothetical protein